MAKLVKDQMLEDEMAKDEMVEDEVAWYQVDLVLDKVYLADVVVHKWVALHGIYQAYLHLTQGYQNHYPDLACCSSALFLILEAEWYQVILPWSSILDGSSVNWWSCYLMVFHSLLELILRPGGFVEGPHLRKHDKEKKY